MWVKLVNVWITFTDTRLDVLFGDFWIGRLDIYVCLCVCSLFAGEFGNKFVLALRVVSYEESSRIDVFIDLKTFFRGLPSSITFKLSNSFFLPYSPQGLRCVTTIFMEHINGVRAWKEVCFSVVWKR